MAIQPIETGAAGETGTAEAVVSETKWVNLSRACSILGVNESTVRRWADSGDIRCFRTPGGHRRFAEGDLFAMIEGRSAIQDRRLETAAVSRIRRQLNSHQQDDWYRQIHEAEREALRPLGRRLVEIVGDYIAGRGHRPQLEQEVEEIGSKYGIALHSRGMPLGQALQAFTFFRRSLEETAKQLADRSAMSSDDALLAREQIGGLADRVLIGLASPYGEGS
jgi:excisionase family DNA binding protein